MARKAQAILLILLALSFMPMSHAKNLGQYGQVFPVIEEDLRQVILKRLKAMEESGALLKHEALISKQVAESILRPNPLSLTSTKAPKTFLIDPTVWVSKDIFTPDGTLLAKKGLAINPFKHIQFSKTLFFFNADDGKQLSWVKNHYKDYDQVKFILTGGDIRKTSELLGRIYFDLNGVISTQLQIKHVPSVVYQKGLFWKVVEIGAQDV